MSSLSSVRRKTNGISPESEHTRRFRPYENRMEPDGGQYGHIINQSRGNNGWNGWIDYVKNAAASFFSYGDKEDENSVLKEKTQIEQTPPSKLALAVQKTPTMSQTSHDMVGLLLKQGRYDTAKEVIDACKQETFENSGSRRSTPFNTSFYDPSPRNSTPLSSLHISPHSNSYRSGLHSSPRSSYLASPGDNYASRAFDQSAMGLYQDNRSTRRRPVPASDAGKRNSGKRTPVNRRMRIPKRKTYSYGDLVNGRYEETPAISANKKPANKKLKLDHKKSNAEERRTSTEAKANIFTVPTITENEGDEMEIENVKQSNEKNEEKKVETKSKVDGFKAGQEAKEKQQKKRPLADAEDVQERKKVKFDKTTRKSIEVPLSASPKKKQKSTFSFGNKKDSTTPSSGTKFDFSNLKKSPNHSNAIPEKNKEESSSTGKRSTPFSTGGKTKAATFKFNATSFDVGADKTKKDGEEKKEKIPDGIMSKLNGFKENKKEESSTKKNKGFDISGGLKKEKKKDKKFTFGSGKEAKEEESTVPTAIPSKPKPKSKPISILAPSSTVIPKTETSKKEEKKDEKKPAISYAMKLIQEKNQKVRDCYRKRLTELYEKHKPDKLGNVEKLMTKYHRALKQFHPLYVKACKKYGVTPLKEFTGDTPHPQGEDADEGTPEESSQSEKKTDAPKKQFSLNNMFGSSTTNKKPMQPVFDFEKKEKPVLNLEKPKSEDIKKDKFMQKVANQQVDFANTAPTSKTTNTPTISINTGNQNPNGNPFALSSTAARKPISFNLPTNTSGTKPAPTSTTNFQVNSSTAQQTPYNFDFNNKGNNNNGGGNNFNFGGNNGNGGGNNNPFGGNNNNGGGNNNPFGGTAGASPFNNMAANTNAFSTRPSPGGNAANKGFTMGAGFGKKRKKY